MACGDPAFAEPLHRLLEPWADHFSTAGGLTAEGPVRLVLAGLETALGRYEDAERDFALAEAFCARVQARFFGARTALLWGQMLMARETPGDVDRARTLLLRAQSEAATGGYAVIERRATAALANLEGS